MADNTDEFPDSSLETDGASLPAQYGRRYCSSHRLAGAIFAVMWTATLIDAETPAPGGDAKWRLVPVYRTENESGERLTMEDAPGPEAGRTNVPVFYGVASREWRPGLVPLFAVEKSGRFELRRKPRPAHENFTEPFVFVLPPESEPDASRIAGAWSIEGTRGDGSKIYLGWELCYENGAIVGRFDQAGEYRWASIRGGSFRTNQLELRVEHIAEAYALTGTMRDGFLQGSWKHLGETEEGHWEARRSGTPIRWAGSTAHLYEWTSTATGRKRYTTLPENAPSLEWVRSPQPLGRVWTSAAPP